MQKNGDCGFGGRLRIHPGIDYRLPLRGDLAGVALAAGSLAIGIAAFPYLGWFFGAALAAGALLAGVLSLWHRRGR